MKEFDLKGLDQAIGKLKQLPNNMRKKVVMGSMRKGSMVVVRAAKANAMGIDDPGTGRKIASNIQARFASKLYRSTGDVAYRVGVATPKGPIPKGNPDEGDKGPTPHWLLKEWGTEKMAAEPFMLPALEANVELATDAVAAEMRKRLDKL
ncbi:HK97-gp10 family putative phage morphogenesis protein [Pantoea sp. 18069]|uniref:HK97-gp10 family putative phage morphogenesis protein n=1 Tax=Pantoea sp. 18069 TaxID=2681415 RepID=UPI0013590EDB|nr:HK97-gp10 family putative phage morphogenesis protein [Pantoea sp. 18069]